MQLSSYLKPDQDTHPLTAHEPTDEKLIFQHPPINRPGRNSDETSGDPNGFRAGTTSSHPQIRKTKQPDPDKDFTNIDGAEDPRSFIEYLDQTTGNLQYRINQKSLIRLLGPRKGDRILDAGCGVGHDAFALAKAVGTKGHVIGMDASRFLLKEAKKRAKKLTPKVEFRLGDAQHLEFPDHSFDRCWTARVLMHLPNPRKAAKEMFRVLKPGGRVLSLEADWETLVITTGNAKRSATLRRLLKNSIRHPGMGHVLPLLFQRAGFQDIVVGAGTYVFSDFDQANMAWRIGPTVNRAVKAGLLSSNQAETFLQELAEDSAAGKFLGAATGFYLTGSKA